MSYIKSGSVYSGWHGSLRSCFTGLLLLLSCIAFAKVYPDGIFKDNMVFQRNQANAVSGYADTEKEVTVEFNGEQYTAGVTDGRWKVLLSNASAGGPYQLSIRGENEIVIRNILVGDVWVCAGQSNMGYSIEQLLEKYPEIVRPQTEGYHNDNIRYFQVKRHASDREQYQIIPGEINTRGWIPISPESALECSAVACFFARKVQEETGIPIGLIIASKGATGAESWVPGGLDTIACSGRYYNAMIAPLTRVSISGVIWYQGEHNARTMEAALQYRYLFTELIKSWREQWGHDFPFYFAQLAAYRDPHPVPVNETWACLRESQSMALSLAGTGMAVLSDAGKKKDIHPPYKKEAGERLALHALKDYYKMEVLAASPSFRCMKIKGQRVLIRFRDVGTGLITRKVNLDGEVVTEEILKGFIICGEDGEWEEADARITAKDKVEIRGSHITEPVAVRYAWADFPVCNLYNSAGLPLIPFRTDIRQ